MVVQIRSLGWPFMTPQKQRNIKKSLFLHNIFGGVRKKRYLCALV